MSKREKMRRKPLSRRNRRSISLRLRYMALSYCQGSKPVRSGRNHGDKTKVQSQLQGLVVLVAAVHNQVQRPRQGPDAAQQFTAFDGVGGLPRREGKGYSRSSICGNHMNLGGPSAARFADGLGSVFFNAPVPSGWTLTVVESRLTASMRMRTICSRCNCSKT